MTCPLCRTFSSRFSAGEGRPYHLCPCCGLIFVPEAHFIPREEEVKRYLEHENSLDNAGYVAMFQKKIDLLAGACPGARSVLDYGCGYEPVLQALLERQGYRADVYDENFFPAAPPRPAYDLVISTETFEHFKTPAREIEKILSLAFPSGFLAVMTRFYPASADGPSLADFDRWYYKRDPTHIVFYSEKTFSWIAGHFDLRIVYNNREDFIVLQKKPAAPAKAPGT